MKKITLVYLIIIGSYSAKSQFEQLDSITFFENAINHRIDVFFSIMKRNNRKEEIKKYKACLIITGKDTINLFHDSIIKINNIFYYGSPPPMELKVKYKNKIYALPNIENYINAPAVNIYFIINDLCIGNKYILQYKYSRKINKPKFYKPEIFIEPLDTYIPKGQDVYKPDSVLIKQNRKKKKYHIPTLPFWF